MALPSGLPDNPAVQAPLGGQTNPSKFPVAATERPENIADLFSHREVVYKNWDRDVGERRLYYVDGIMVFMRMLKVQKITFLKEKDYIKNAIYSVTKSGNKKIPWTDQANFKWEEDVAANQLRRIQEGKPVSFTKAAYAIVACELFLKDSKVASPYWVYDYMRIIPAVYNIDKLNNENVGLLVNQMNAKISLETVAGKNYRDVLGDMAAGKCVTAPTASGFSKLIQSYPELGIGAARFKPGRKTLGRGHATENEDIEIS